MTREVVPSWLPNIVAKAVACPNHEASQPPTAEGKRSKLLPAQFIQKQLSGVRLRLHHLIAALDVLVPCGKESKRTSLWSFNRNKSLNLLCSSAPNRPTLALSRWHVYRLSIVRESRVLGSIPPKATETVSLVAATLFAFLTILGPSSVQDCAWGPSASGNKPLHKSVVEARGWAGWMWGTESLSGSLSGFERRWGVRAESYSWLACCWLFLSFSTPPFWLFGESLGLLSMVPLLCFAQGSKVPLSLLISLTSLPLL